MRTPRPFTLGDLMALVAAAALGLTLDRWRAAEPGPSPPGFSTTGIQAVNWVHVLRFGGPTCYVVALTLVLIPLRWIRPRRPASRILRQPGAVACLATLGMILANLALMSFSRRLNDLINGRPSELTIYAHGHQWSEAIAGLEMAVGGAWAALALGSRWSPEPSWIDRAGRLLGAYWILVDLLGIFSGFVHLWFPYKG